MSKTLLVHMNGDGKGWVDFEIVNSENDLDVRASWFLKVTDGHFIVGSAFIRERYFSQNICDTTRFEPEKNVRMTEEIAHLLGQATRAFASALKKYWALPKRKQASILKGVAEETFKYDVCELLENYWIVTSKLSASFRKIYCTSNHALVYAREAFGEGNYELKSARGKGDESFTVLRDWEL